MFEWAYSGVDHTLAGNGGEECARFISPGQKVAETILFTGLALLEVCVAYPHTRLPKVVPVTEQRERTSKKVLLVIMCLTFGIELGFKLATRQMVWVLNPCHIVTLIQIYLLVAPPTKTTMATFRVHMHCLSGASIAILLPVVNTRLLPFETEIYYIQHILMLVIPYYLMRVGGVYTPEPLTDLWWTLLSCGLLFMYHWIVLQGLAVLTLVNLNNMICPAVSDPFYGQWYRAFASVHQTLIILSHGKVYVVIASWFLPSRHQRRPIREDEHPESNGYAKLH